MSKSLEPLLAVKESKNEPTKYRGTIDGNADGWMMLMKRHLESACLRDPTRQSLDNNRVLGIRSEGLYHQ